jgi:hypothetical protein
MMPTRFRKLALIPFLFSLCAAGPVAGQQSLTNNANLLSKARQKYYNLRDAGLIEFQANIQPNWEVVLGDLAAYSGNRAVLNGLKFSCSLDPEGKLHFSHSAEVLPRDQASADRVVRVIRNMEDALRGLFRNWSIFSLSSPFPQVGTDYSIHKREGGYKVSQRQAELLVEVDSDNDFKVTEIRVSGPEVNASLKPVLESTPTGFLLKGYTANSQRLSGARATTIQAALEYETVSGLRLLRRVVLDTTFEGLPAKVEWLFTDYQVKVR